MQTNQPPKETLIVPHKQKVQKHTLIYKVILGSAWSFQALLTHHTIHTLSVWSVIILTEGQVLIEDKVIKIQLHIPPTPIFQGKINFDLIKKRNTK